MRVFSVKNLHKFTDLLKITERIHHELTHFRNDLKVVYAVCVHVQCLYLKTSANKSKLFNEYMSFMSSEFDIKKKALKSFHCQQSVQCSSGALRCVYSLLIATVISSSVSI